MEGDFSSNTDTELGNIPSNMHKDAINVHRGVLSQTSKFFAKATKGEWCELRKDPDTITLKGDDLKVVKAYVRWLYRQEPPLPLLGNKVVGNAFIFLAKAYVFGEKVMDTAFKNTIIDCTVANVVESNSFPGSRAMNIIYGGTPDGSPARRLIVDFYAYAAYVTSETDVWAKNIRNFSKELLVDVLIATVTKRPGLGKGPWESAAHLYHEEDS
jgi:hypothetical protein